MSRRVLLPLSVVVLSLSCAATALWVDDPAVSQALARATQLIQSGKLADARSELSRNIRLYPQEGGLYDLLGVVQAQQGDYRGAERNFLLAVAKSPRLTGAYLNLGRLYQEHAAMDGEAEAKALQAYGKVLQYEPANAEAHYQSAVLLLRRKAYGESLRHLRRLDRDAQAHPQALAAVCADLAGMREMSAARAAADRLLASPQLTEADVMSVLPALSASAAALRLHLLEGWVARGSASAAALRELATAYRDAGDLPRARTTLEHVAQVEPLSAALLLELAQLAYQQKDIDGALGYVAHARDLEPANPAPHFFFGMLCVERELPDEAFHSLQRAVQLDPGNAFYNYAFGAVLIQKESAREAVPYFQKYCALRPSDVRGRFALGVAHFYNFDYASARRELLAVADSAATSAGAHFFLGRMDSQEGKLDSAEREIGLALKTDPANVDAQAELGMVFIKQRKFAAAESVLQRALSAAPQNYLANLNLLILYQRTRDARAAQQAEIFARAKQQRADRAKQFFRTIEVRP